MANKGRKKTGHAYNAKSTINSPKTDTRGQNGTIESRGPPEETKNKDLPKVEDYAFAVKPYGVKPKARIEPLIASINELQVPVLAYQDSSAICTSKEMNNGLSSGVTTAVNIEGIAGSKMD